MNNIKNNIKKSFSMIPNALILDSGLSDRARFVFCLLASKPDDWVFFSKSLAKELGYSVETLRKYISELKDFGWIEVVNEDFKPNSYVLKSTNSTVSGKVRHGKSPTREKSDTYKEVLKDISTFNKEVPKEGNQVRKRKPSTISNEEWIERLKNNPAYRGIDFERLNGKLVAWCEMKGLKPTRARFLNWLNREDIPLNKISGIGESVMDRQAKILREVGDELRNI